MSTTLLPSCPWPTRSPPSWPLQDPSITRHRPPEDPGRILAEQLLTVLFPKLESLPGLVLGRGPLARPAEPSRTGVNGDRAAGPGGWQVLEAASHRFHLQLHAVHGLHLMEGGVGADDHEGGSCRKTGSSGPGCLTWPPLPTALPRPCTHPGPRRRRSLRRPARRRERRRSQPEHTDGLGSPLGLGQTALGQLF